VCEANPQEHADLVQVLLSELAIFPKNMHGFPPWSSELAALAATDVELLSF
jgi:hypothetical protein